MNKAEALGMLKFEEVKYASPTATSEKDYEIGFVSSVNDNYIHIKFKTQLDKLGWINTTSQACRHEDVTAVKGYYNGFMDTPDPKYMNIKSWGEAMTKGVKPEETVLREKEGFTFEHMFKIFEHQDEKGL